MYKVAVETIAGNLSELVAYMATSTTTYYTLSW